MIIEDVAAIEWKLLCLSPNNFSCICTLYFLLVKSKKALCPSRDQTIPSPLTFWRTQPLTPHLAFVFCVPLNRVRLNLSFLRTSLWTHPSLQSLLHFTVGSGGIIAQLSLTLCDPMDCSPPDSSSSRGFFRQEYWSGLPFPSPGDLPYPRIESGSPALQAGSLPSEPPGKPFTSQLSC